MSRWLLAEVVSCKGCAFHEYDEEIGVVLCNHPLTRLHEITDKPNGGDYTVPDFPVWCPLPRQLKLYEYLKLEEEV
jgi:hypothetical protein